MKVVVKVVDGQTDRLTLVVVESLSRLKINGTLWLAELH